MNTVLTAEDVAFLRRAASHLNGDNVTIDTRRMVAGQLTRVLERAVTLTDAQVEAALALNPDEAAP